MVDLIYTTKVSSIGPFLDHIQTASVPSKVTQVYLEQVGFKSTNDRPLIGVMKAIGFIDSSGQPTARWKQYKDKAKGGAVLAGGVREAYSALFDVYPDAQNRDNEALHNVLSSGSGLSENTVSRSIKTFRALSEKADFEADGSAPVAILQTQGLPTGVAPPAHNTPVININIQLEIPKTDDATVYDNLFAAMKKHLIDVGTDSA